VATRGLSALVVALAVTPGVAMAQVDRPIIWEGQTPTIKAHGAVPPPRNVVAPPDTTTAAEKVAAGAGLAGAGAALATEGVTQAARRAESLGSIVAVERAGIGSQVLGNTATVVNAGANLKVAAEKCQDPKASTADCVQAQLNLYSSEASVIDLVQKGAGSAGTAAQGLQVAADATGAYNKCWADKDATKLDCVASLSDTFISATSNLPGGGKVVAASYSIAKTVLPTAVDEAGKWWLGKSPGEWFYDKYYAAEDNARIEAASKSAALKAKQSAARRAAYQQAAGALASKQADYDAQQARLAAERQAAEQQAYVNNQNAAQAQALASSIAAVVQARLAPPVTASSTASGSRSAPSEDPCANSPDPYCSRR